MKIHALTLTWNGADLIRNLRDSLEPNIYCLGNVPLVWHIRDNGSEDNTKDEVPDWAKLYEIGHNRDSFAQGMNFLFKEANPDDDDLVLLLNNDIVFSGSSNLLSMFNLHDRAKADVTGTVLTADGVIKHAGVIFSRKYGYMPWHFLAGERLNGRTLKARYFQAVTAACCLVNAGAWRKVGGMDEVYRWAFEDVDLCLKIGQLRKNNIICTHNLGIQHGESVSLKKNPVNKMFMQHNVKHFKSRWWGKYKIDHDKYLRDNNYNEVKV